MIMCARRRKLSGKQSTYGKGEKKIQKNVN
jgi:hypothetical protein